MPAHPDAVTLAVAACQAADDKKASDLVILEVADILALVDLFVVVSAGSDRQLKAVAEEVERVLRDDHERRPLRREGTPESGWVLLDYGDVVCQLFLTAQRSHYDLERLWSDVARYEPATGERLEPAAVARAAGEDGA